MTNFTDLLEFLTTTFGDKNFQITFEENSRRPAITHDSLMDSVGIFSNVIKSVDVCFFNFGKTETGFWGTLCISYNSFSGGSNAMTAGTVWYDAATEKWTIETELQKFNKYNK